MNICWIKALDNWPLFIKSEINSDGIYGYYRLYIK